MTGVQTCALPISGMTAADQEVAGMLQRSKKPIVLAVNKMDSTGAVDPDFYEFYNLGLGDPIAVSAVHGHGTGDCGRRTGIRQRENWFYPDRSELYKKERYMNCRRQMQKIYSRKETDLWEFLRP